jgi:NAD(P)-dependent dehydrogenase (short-subunit alcohol dehydrogenase family)/acyl carrier protein
LENEDIFLPPVSVFSGHNVKAAFRFMQRSGHLGKIVVTPPKPGKNARGQVQPVRGTWLVVGGTSGFGLSMAKWLIKKGAKTVWLASRTGAMAAKDVKALEEIGAEVFVRSCDVTHENELKDLLDEIGEFGTGLSGVVHSAMLLDDALFKDMDEARIRTVVAPKLRGAMNLDRLTRSFQLEHFLLFGSVVSRFGSFGQSAYVAANSGLEEIAARRVAEKLPALTIAWGPIVDSGYLARHHVTREIVEKQFGRLMPAGEALDMLGEVLVRGTLNRSSITVAPVDWRELKRSTRVVNEPLFEFMRIGETSSASQSAFDIHAEIRNKGEQAAQETVLGIMKIEVAKILQMASSDINSARPLTDYGFDSLMGVNLALAAEERLGSSLPVSSVSSDLTLEHLSSLIVRAALTSIGANTIADMSAKHLTQTKIPADVVAQIQIDSMRK